MLGVEELRHIPHLQSNPVAANFERGVPIAASQGRFGIRAGQVVAIPADQDGPWKRCDDQYYAYVQGIEATSKGRFLKLLWLYKPSDTVCRSMAYPHLKELFLSDHCNCDHSAKVYESEVTAIPKVAFYGSPYTLHCDFFCRQQYLENDQAWMTLSKDHFRCHCRTVRPPSQTRCSIGCTVLARLTTRSRILEPVIVIDPGIDGETGVKVRLLLRRGRDYKDPKAMRNELVYTEQYRTLQQRFLDRRCHVRCFQKASQIPFPYDREGIGDFYFVSGKDTETIPSLYTELQAMSLTDERSMQQGWLPTEMNDFSSRLSGLDIFCGGGTFGRGLEDGDVVDFKWAVDYKAEAIHTYKANLKDSSKTKLFFGSVNDYLSQAMSGQGIGVIAQKGEVDVIIAGSPCQGFSSANPMKGVHHKGLINESMVASVVSYIDFYRPKYALLENVKGMASGGDDKNMLAQILCSLVGMGYQTRSFALDAWSYGSPQSRSRVFISCTAPGLEPLLEPPHTHSHPPGISAGSLGKTASGMPINPRCVTMTPLACRLAGEATIDLPVTDGRIACLKFPDHRLSRNISTIDRVRISAVPRYPSGQGFLHACKKGYMPMPQMQRFVWTNNIRAGKSSTCWTRVKPNAVMPTILTEPRPSDGVNGKCLHWDQHRLLTIQEVRRAQGFPDHEVLVGSPAEQWRIVGNSVARPVAFALGLSLRHAWLASMEKQANTAAKQTINFPSAVAETSTPLKPIDQSSDSIPPDRAVPIQVIKLKASPIVLLRFDDSPKRNSWANQSIPL